MIFTGDETQDLFQAGQHFEECQFINADLKNVTLSRVKFSDCRFEDCNLERCFLVDTFFQDVQFKNCRLLGLDFDPCSRMLLKMHFEESKLSVCSFKGLDLRECSFSKTELQEVDFGSCNCQGVTFNECDLSRSLFERTDLRKADLREAHNFTIDPEQNRLQGARFSRATLDGLLSKYGLAIE